MESNVRTWSKSAHDLLATTSTAASAAVLTILHHISDDSEFVKVSASALRPKWFLEGDLNTVDVVSIPGRTEELISEAEDEDVLDHLFSEVVVDTEDLLLFPVRLKRLLQFSRASKILSKWLLDL
jgi:hypothetical protein